MNAPLTPPTSIAGEQPIGAILMAAGRLRAEENERILRLQRDKGLRFGEAAVQLGLASERDIRYAMARQFDYPYLQRGKSRVSLSLVAAYDPFCAQAEALRAVRSELSLRWFDSRASHKTLAVVSAQSGEGRSWMAANLAVMFSQLGERTLLIDADLRRPTLHRLFGLETRSGLSSLLYGRSAPDVLCWLPDMRLLALLPAGVVPPNPQELLARPAFAQLLQQYTAAFDVVIIDTPPGDECADGIMVAVRAKGALMLTRPHLTRVAAVRRYARRLHAAGVELAGSVLNGD